jgi:hypothetical protein
MLEQVYPMAETQLFFVYIHLDPFPYLQKTIEKIKTTIINSLQTYCKGIKSGHHNLHTTVDVRTHVNCAQSTET